MGCGDRRLRFAASAHGRHPHRVRAACNCNRRLHLELASAQARGKPQSKRIACTDKLVIPRVPYALDRANSGVSVTVSLPDGRELTEPEVVVEDLFIVALGDSFASGESNPDRP